MHYGYIILSITFKLSTNSITTWNITITTQAVSSHNAQKYAFTVDSSPYQGSVTQFILQHDPKGRPQSARQSWLLLNWRTLKYDKCQCPAPHAESRASYPVRFHFNYATHCPAFTGWCPGIGMVRVVTYSYGTSRIIPNQTRVISIVPFAPIRQDPAWVIDMS